MRAAFKSTRRKAETDNNLENRLCWILRITPGSFVRETLIFLSVDENVLRFKRLTGSQKDTSLLTILSLIKTAAFVSPISLAVRISVLNWSGKTETDTMFVRHFFHFPLD